MDAYTGKKTNQMCQVCHAGWLHQYPQDPAGKLRCGRCGELKADKKPATTRKANDGIRD